MNIEEIKKAKENRKGILDFLYQKRGGENPWVRLEELTANTGISGDDLRKEMIYLRGKGFIDFPSNMSRKEWSPFMHISSEGIDLAEDPEEYGKLFSIKIHNNSFRDINNSNVSIDSGNIQQIINNETDPDLKLKLEELQNAVRAKDKSRIMSALGYIADKSVDVLISIIAGSIK